MLLKFGACLERFLTKKHAEGVCEIQLSLAVLNEFEFLGIYLGFQDNFVNSGRPDAGVLQNQVGLFFRESGNQDDFAGRYHRDHSFEFVKCGG